MFCKKLFLEISLTPATLSKKRLWHRCFPVNFGKFLRTPFLTEHLWWLLLKNLRQSSLLVYLQVCEFCEISKNTFSYRTPLVAASEKPTTELFISILAGRTTLLKKVFHYGFQFLQFFYSNFK